MIRWHTKLYFDKGLENDKKRDKIKENVSARKLTFPGTTGIFLSVNEDNIAELIPFNDMLLPAYAKLDFSMLSKTVIQENIKELYRRIDTADTAKEIIRKLNCGGTDL